MKKSFATIAFLLFAMPAFSQNESINKDYYLRRCKRKKTCAWIFLGVGVVSTGFAALGVPTALDGPAESPGGSFFLITGLVAFAISIRLFIVSSKNKKKSMELSYNSEKIQLPDKN